MKYLEIVINYIKKNKGRVLEYSAITLVLVVVTIFFVQETNISRENMTGVNDGYLEAGLPTPGQNSQPSIKKTTTPNATADKGDYDQEIASFEGRRIQIKDCQATPNKITYKTGTTILLDGYSDTNQVITIGSKSTTLYGYDLAYMQLDGSDQDKTQVQVDCLHDGVQRYNIATILIQP